MPPTNKVALFILLALGALVFLLMKLLHFNGLYGQDAHEYLRYARELHNNFGTARGLPNYLPVYPALAALLGFMVPIPEALQFISIFSYALTIYVLFLSIRLIYPGNQAAFLFVLCFGFLAPYPFRVACTDMTDPLATLLLLTTFYLVVSYIQSGRFRFFLLAVALALVCIFTRFAARVPVSKLFACLLVMEWRKSGLIAVMKMLGALLPLLLVLFIFNNKIVFSIAQLPLGRDFAISNIFRHTFSSDEGSKSYALPNVLTVLYPLLHPGFVFAGLLFFAGLKKEFLLKKEVLLCLIPAIAYLLFLCCFPQQNPRLQCLVSPFILIPYAPAFELIFNRIKQKRTFIIGSVFVQLAFILLSMRTIYTMNRSEREIAAYLKPMAKDFRYVYQLGSEGIVQSYDVDLIPLELFGDTLGYLHDSSLLLLQTDAFAQQWKGRLPFRNYEFIQAHARLALMRQFENGYSLYVIHKHTE